MSEVYGAASERSTAREPGANDTETRRSPEAIAAERAARQTDMAKRQAEAVGFDTRRAEIGERLMELYAEGGGISADLEVYINAGGFLDDAASALAEYEVEKRGTRPNFDIAAKHPKLILRALKQAFEARADQAALAEKEETLVAEKRQTRSDADAVDDAQAAKAERQAERSAEARRSAFFEAYKESAALDLLEAAAASPDLTQAERARAAAFLRIRALAQSEADAARITALIEAQDFASGIPDPMAFLRYQVFSSPAHDTGVSEATQEAIAKAFGIERPPRVETGGDVRRLATMRTTDPETGEASPAYTEDHPAEFRPGVGTWSRDGDDVYLTAMLPGHPSLTREVTGWSDEDIGLLAEAMGFTAGLEQFGATGFVEDVYKIDFALFGQSAFDRGNLRQVRQMISAMVGSFEGYDGDIFDVREKIGLIRHQARLLNPAGTATGFENDREATRIAARRLDLRNEEGRINLDVMRAFGAYAQETWLTGDPSHADLHARLYRQFPQFVEPPEDPESARESDAPDVTA